MVTIDDKRMTKSKEDYLKVILELSESCKEIHSTNIAEKMNITKASVSRMLSELNDLGYVAKEKYSYVTLTQRGKEFAAQIQKRHDLLKIFLTEILGVDEKTAARDACNLEHSISSETAEKLNSKINNLIDCCKRK